jgi:outer membrane protein assembly factor BamB
MVAIIAKHLNLKKVQRRIYGRGRETDCNHYYYALDWTTGRTTWRKKLGDSEDFDDPGNANVLDENGHLTFSSKRKIVQLRIKE